MKSDDLISAGEDFAVNVLVHYSSKYYDPAKAREYYLRTRELKGRRSTKGLTEEGKIAWKYAKDKITEEKKQSLKGNSENQKTELKGLRKEASDKRKILSEKIKELLKDVSEDTKAKIEAVPKVPKGLSKEARAKAALKRKEEIAKIRGEANLEKKGTREMGAEERKQMASDLKGVVLKARDKYTELRETIKADYEAKYQAEYDAIKANV